MPFHEKIFDAAFVTKDALLVYLFGAIMELVGDNKTVCNVKNFMQNVRDGTLDFHRADRTQSSSAGIRCLHYIFENSHYQ